MTLQPTEYDKIKEQFNEWATHNSHNIMTSFPKSGRNVLGDIIRLSSGSTVSQGLPKENIAQAFSNIDLFVLHRGIWEIRGDKGRYILLLRDPRDAILSRTYTRANRAEKAPEEIMADPNWVTSNIKEWKTYFEAFLQYEPHLIQYERLCLFPVKEVTELLNYLGLKTVAEIEPIVSNCDSVKPDPRKEFEHISVTFDTGSERYMAHCLKWQRDPLVKEAFVNTVWQELGEIMEPYGYTETGHSQDLIT